MKKFIPYLMLTILISPALMAQETEALRALRISCEKHKVALGCFNYANMLVRRNNLDSDKYFTLGCDLKHSPSCQKEQWAPMDIKPDIEIAMPTPAVQPEEVPAEPMIEQPAVEVAQPEEDPAEPVIDQPAVEVAQPEKVPAEPVIEQPAVEVAQPEAPSEELVAPEINIESMQEEPSQEMEVALPEEVPAESSPGPSPAPASVGEPESTSL